MGSSSFNMLNQIVSLSLVAVVQCQYPAAVPAVPGNIPGLQEGTLGAAQWWQSQALWQQQQLDHIGKREATLPAVPNVPGGDIWWQQQLVATQQQAVWQQQQVAARGKRSATLPAVPGAGQWWQQQLLWQQQQLNEIARGKREATPTLPAVPNVPGGGQWWQQQLVWQQQQANFRGKRQAALPVVPGNIPGLVPGSPAAAQWWQQQAVWQQQQVAASG